MQAHHTGHSLLSRLLRAGPGGVGPSCLLTIGSRWSLGPSDPDSASFNIPIPG